MDAARTYTIMETARISGLSESTLRYYETIGLIEPIRRDTSSKHRVYSENDVNIVISIACLNATGLSIEDMRAYLKNRNRGTEAAAEQVSLLTSQKERLEEEMHLMKLRQQYVDIKITYWKAVRVNDTEQIQRTKERADVLARQLKLPKALTKDT